MDAITGTGLGTLDLTNCDREPIQIPGAIQPIGFLVALTGDWFVARASANVGAFLPGLTPEAMLGHLFSDFATPDSIHAIRNRMATLRGADAVERMPAVRLRPELPPFDVAVHMAGGQIVLECEPSDPSAGTDAAGTVRSMSARLKATEDMDAFLREGARQVRGLTGFDRVMVYRFHHDGAGEVVAEAVKAGIGSFKGLRYPAADIPRQARELYVRNTFRLIADIDAPRVPIVPELDERGRPLDLSLSLFRVSSPIHIEYLRNMGVTASMSISILVGGKLWGLFACHHYAPRCPGFEKRSIAELFGQMFSMSLEAREQAEAIAWAKQAQDVSDQLMTAVASDESLLNDPDWIGDILRHSIPADGVGVWIAGDHALSGDSPSVEGFARIVRRLNATATGRVYATDRIADLVPDIGDLSPRAAGMLAIPISRSPRDYVILFRGEVARTVSWAGDPRKVETWGPNGPRLSPRRSFETWNEEVRGRSKPFSDPEVRVAETIRATLIEVVLRLSEEAHADRRRAADRQEILIAELNHRVRNILGLIRGLVRQSKPDSGRLEDYVELVDGRIHALARAHNQITRDHWGPAPLRGLIAAEASAYLGEGTAQLEVEGEDIFLEPTAYSAFALVLHELVTNSAKYGALSRLEGRVRLSWSGGRGGEDLHIHWREAGGPAVKPPTRKGFGTTIIHRSIPYDLGGRVAVRYEPAGFEADLCIPDRHVAEQQGSNRPAIDLAKPPPNHPAPPQAFLEGRQVLLVEDSLIIALDAEDILRRLGADDVQAAASADNALALLADFAPDLMVLDVNLGAGTSFPIAAHARERGIPYIFATGYGQEAQLPPEHAGATILQKPYTLENMARVLAEVVG